MTMRSRWPASRSIWGPYESHPDKHLITAADAPGHPIQRTGHGQYVEGPDGQGWHTFLMGRPIQGPDGSNGRFCPLGRETGIERVVWSDDWLYLEAGGQLPRVELPGPTEADRRQCGHPIRSSTTAPCRPSSSGREPRRPSGSSGWTTAR